MPYTTPAPLTSLDQSTKLLVLTKPYVTEEMFDKAVAGKGAGWSSCDKTTGA